MHEKQLVNDYLRDRLQTEREHARNLFTSCTLSTIRWLQRYSHCYSFFCSFLCIPLWLLILPIAFVFDICIFISSIIIFILSFVIYFLIAPCAIAWKFSSCSDAWKPINIYLYSFPTCAELVLFYTFGTWHVLVMLLWFR